MQAKLGRFDERHKAEGALIVTQKNVAKQVLEKHSLKLRKGRTYRSRAAFDHAAFAKGKEDSKNIDLDRRAIDKK